MWASERIRGTVAITLVDLDRICEALEISPLEFMAGGVPARYAARYAAPGSPALSARQQRILATAARLSSAEEGEAPETVGALPPDAPGFPPDLSRQELLFLAGVALAMRQYLPRDKPDGEPLKPNSQHDA